MNTVEQDDTHPTATGRRGIAVTAVIVVTLLGAAPLFLWRRPMGFAWDESYYVPAARSYLDGVFDVKLEHPPLGKWLIAAGIQLIGDEPLGWGVASLVAGIVTVPLVWFLARRLLGSTAWATVAAFLVAIDGLLIVQSRTAVLDSLLPPLIVGATLAVLVHLDRGYDRRRLSGPLLIAGGLLGAAVACKWEALPALLGAIGLWVLPPVGPGHAAHDRDRLRRRTQRGLPRRPRRPAHPVRVRPSGVLPDPDRCRQLPPEVPGQPRTVEPGLDLALAADPAQLHLGIRERPGCPPRGPRQPGPVVGLPGLPPPPRVRLVAPTGPDGGGRALRPPHPVPALAGDPAAGFPLLPHPPCPVHGHRPDLQPPLRLGPGWRCHASFRAASSSPGSWPSSPSCPSGPSPPFPRRASTS